MKRFLFLILLFIISIRVYAQEIPQPNAQVAYMDTRLLVRQSPYLDSATVGHLDAGELITVVGRSADSLWLETTAHNGFQGWVNADFVRVIQNLPDIPVTHDRNMIGMTADLPSEVVENIRLIYQLGQAAGNQGDVFSKVGDSITVSPHMYAPISSEYLNLGNFYYLQDVIDHFTKTQIRNGDNSFEAESLAAGIGWSAPVVLNPRFANEDWCMEDESPLLCEYRINHPAFALIMFGTNDLGRFSSSSFYYHYERIIEASLGQHVIPIISTVPPRVDFEDKVQSYNEVITRLATKYQLPLWDYGGAMQNIYDGGLDDDGVHPSIPPMGIRGSADFRTYNLPYGYVICNLTALQMLDVVWQAVQDV